MHGWTYRRYGGPEVLEWTSLPATPPGEGEIAVRVVAASLNPLDWKLREGMFKLFARGVPRGMGYDYAGVVEAAGPGVTRFKAGDAVVGMLDPIRAANGALAERVVAPADHAAAKPDGVSFEDAASFPGAGIMAVQSLRQAGVRSGQSVLIVGAAGGVAAHALPGAKLFLWSLWLRLTAKERCLPITERVNIEDLRRLVDLAAAGRLRSVVTRLGRPEEVPEIQRAMRSGRSRGKIVVRMAADSAPA